MILDLDYRPLFVILSWFMGIGIALGLGIVFLKNSFDDLIGKVEDFIQTIRSLFDVFRD